MPLVGFTALLACRIDLIASLFIVGFVLGDGFTALFFVAAPRVVGFVLYACLRLLGVAQDTPPQAPAEATALCTRLWLCGGAAQPASPRCLCADSHALAIKWTTSTPS